jgi:Bifunctional DNA primase/polymerase, N-terminal
MLPEMLAVTTGRADGGEHRYFRMPTGVDIRNDQNGKMARHSDVRKTGGFVVPTVSSRHREAI